jgi:hypothetical protein
MMAARVITYKSKSQPTIELSSTEADFTATSSDKASKMMLYLGSILHELGFSQYLPTLIWRQHQPSTLHMVNAQQPTRCIHHMDMKCFALQDWVEHDQIEVTQIGTANNISDAFRKALGRIKFDKQTDFIMGRHIPPWVPDWVKQDHPTPTKRLDFLITILLSSPSIPRLISALESIQDLLPLID